MRRIIALGAVALAAAIAVSVAATAAPGLKLKPVAGRFDPASG